MKFKKTAICAAAMLLMTVTAGCGSKEPPFDTSTMTDHQFLITLYPDDAPITCENFESLVSEGFYNGIVFHRVMEDFMAQGGDPTGTGMGGSEKTIKGEFSSNGVQNTLSHTRGVVSMARSGDPNSASSQFFICYSDADTFLDGNYAAFGKVTAGMEVLDDFLKVPLDYSATGELSVPTSPITIDTAVMVGPDAEGHPQALFTMKDFLPADSGQADSQEDTPADSQEDTPADSQEDAPADSQEDAPADSQEDAPAEQ
ncbi:MAG: peptidylprolyl isomerase [Oscillospiraceae bacterium]|nr:peptidylprolyl isomerase [Oscillospiraceae bacterium]